MWRPLFWLGAALCATGAVVVVASAIMAYLGLSASYNLGDPAKFQFVLVPFWLIGVGLAGIGVLFLLASSQWKRVPQ